MAPFRLLDVKLPNFFKRFLVNVINCNTGWKMQEPALSSFKQTGTYYDDSIVMKGQIDQFADALSQQMLRVQVKTQQLTESLTSTLTHMTESNGSLMAASQHALSELQFQDPLAQDLMRTLHEAHKLRSLIVHGQVDDFQDER